MFGFTIISKERLTKLEWCERRVQSLHHVHRWFAGWRDLDIIWDYLLCNNQKTIEDTRREYAEARKTDVYGKPKDSK